MRIPVATYRLQFSPDFGFKSARGIISYLQELGISEIYASPIFKAKKGSPHGYDVVDMNIVNPDLGTEEDFDGLIDDLKKRKMSWIQDVVPNHMAFDGENQMLMDVLENGPNSEFFEFFDVEWEHFSETLSNRLLAPFLGKHYGETLDSREIVLRYDDSGFYFTYYSLRLPMKIESYVDVMTHRLKVLKEKLGEDHPDLVKFLGILYSLKNLPESTEERMGRYSQIQFVKRILWELFCDNDDIRNFINENLDIINGGKDRCGEVDLLDHLLSHQLFRLAFWKVATEELNYRRFFNINGLISLRVEDERVFNLTHTLIFRLLRERKISGLRIDHIDGLYDPTTYLRWLREKSDDAYIVVEKILELDEQLPNLWAIQGTSGYDFLNYLNGIFCDERKGSEFNKLYYKFTGIKASYDSLFYEKKKLVIEKDMTGDVDNLAHLLKKISSNDRYGSDITQYSIRRAIVEILSFLPVYRTYIRKDYCSEADTAYIRAAVDRAREANPGRLYELDFVERFLLLKYNEFTPEEEKDEWVNFVMKFQQVSGPLMAKGVEDTILYVYNRLISLNEVGGNPDRFGISATEFHEFNLKRSRWQPHTMNTASTHDTKRGEDVRARINVLSELPDLWESNLRRWSRLNRKKKKTMKGTPIPDKNDEYFLYQTLIGALPFKQEEHESFKNRLKEYIIKAVREAKRHTAWLKPDTDYEENFMTFIEKIMAPSEKNHFLNEFMQFQRMVASYGIFNSLSQTLVKITSPGVPDFYQGGEFWDFNLVDPDNRRPIDYELRAWLFREMKAKEKEGRAELLRELVHTKEDGRIKLYLIYKALALRHTLSNVFENGEYLPLDTDGAYKDHVIAYAWHLKPVWAIIVVPRFLTALVEQEHMPFGREVWHDTHVVMPEGAPSEWKEQLTGNKQKHEHRLNIGDALQRFPCALLTNMKKR